VEMLDPIGKKENAKTIIELIDHNWNIIRSAHF